MFGGQPMQGAVPMQTPAFGQLTPEQLMAANQRNGIQSPVSGMALKSMTVDPIAQKISQTYGQSPEAEADMQVKTATRKDALGRMGKLQELLPLLDNFESQLDAIPVGSGVSGKFQGLSAVAQGAINKDPFAAATMSQLEALRPQIARAFGDVGNLSQTEQEAARKFMPELSDSQDTRKVKIVSGLLFLKRKLEQGARNAGVSDDPEYQQKFGLLNQRLRSSLRGALEAGASPKKLAKFAGADVLKSLGVKKYKTQKDAEADTSNLINNNGYRFNSVFDFYSLSISNVLLQNVTHYIVNIFFSPTEWPHGIFHTCFCGL